MGLGLYDSGKYVWMDWLFNRLIVCCRNKMLELSLSCFGFMVKFIVFQ